MFRIAQFGRLLALMILSASTLSAQVFKLEGGTSSLFNAEGGSLNIKALNYESTIGAGIFEGHFQWGAVARTNVMGYTVTAGDDSVRFDLPTDVFGNTSYFSARGFGISKNDENSGFYILGGLTSRWMGSGFFQAARSEDPVGLVFFHHRLTDKLHFYSRDLVSKKSTSLQALEWQPEKWLKTSVTAGLGSGHPYFASAFDAELRKLSLKFSYSTVNPDFRRITVPELLNSEPERENIEAVYHFSQDMTITASHRNLMQPLTVDSALSRASSDQIGGNFRVGRTYFGAGLFSSRFSGTNSWGSNLFLGYRYRQFLDVNGSYFASKSTNSGLDSMVSGTFREILTPRLSVLQVITYSNGQWSSSYGGEFVTNRFNASVDYQTVYLAFRTRNPFQQTLSFNAQVRVMGPMSLSAASSLAPDGRVRYTFGMRTYLYRYKGLMPSWSQAGDSYKFPKYVVQGVVRDEHGEPVAGAAIQIDKDVVYSDGTGRFMYRVKKNRTLNFQIAPDQFLAPGIYEVLKAPVTVTPDKEDQTQDVEVIVRRISSEQAVLMGLIPPKSPAHAQ